MAPSRGKLPEVLPKVKRDCFANSSAVPFPALRNKLAVSQLACFTATHDNKNSLALRTRRRRESARVPGAPSNPAALAYLGRVYRQISLSRRDYAGLVPSPPSINRQVPATMRPVHRGWGVARKIPPRACASILSPRECRRATRRGTRLPPGSHCWSVLPLLSKP